MIESFQRTVICHVREKLPPLGLCCGLVWEVVTLCHLGSQLPRSPGDAASSTELCDARFQACSDSSSLSAPSALVQTVAKGRAVTSSSSCMSPHGIHAVPATQCSPRQG